MVEATCRAAEIADRCSPPVACWLRQNFSPADPFYAWVWPGRLSFPQPVNRVDHGLQIYRSESNPEGQQGSSEVWRVSGKVDPVRLT
jgi:hypothetical protein